MENCLACDIIKGGIKTPGGFVFQDEFWTVTHSVSEDGAPLKGMLILQTKRHCTNLAELNLNEMANLGILLRETCKVVHQLLHPAKIYACSVGEGIKHMHFMILPRLDGMPIGAELFKQVIEQHKWMCSFEDASDFAVKAHNIFDPSLLQVYKRKSMEND